MTKKKISQEEAVSAPIEPVRVSDHASFEAAVASLPAVEPSKEADPVKRYRSDMDNAAAVAKKPESIAAAKKTDARIVIMMAPWAFLEFGAVLVTAATQIEGHQVGNDKAWEIADMLAHGGPEIEEFKYQDVPIIVDPRISYIAVGGVRVQPTAAEFNPTFKI